MFSIACKGLHCAGCGKGIPASLIVIIAAIVAFNSRAFDNALGRTLVEIAALVALAWVVTMVLYVVFMRKGPRIVNTKTDGIWYSEIKYMETAAPVIIGSEVEHVERNTRLRVALLHGRASKRQDV
jgi:hypothetical protein